MNIHKEVFEMPPARLSMLLGQASILTYIRTLSWKFCRLKSDLGGDVRDEYRAAALRGLAEGSALAGIEDLHRFMYNATQREYRLERKYRMALVPMQQTVVEVDERILAVDRFLLHSNDTVGWEQDDENDSDI